ncbi:DUF3192 domain-containing protein [Gemmatimonas phototrophica]|nr:DUF3192 domain-containing protein [Gemmatimonas phototrophica]
MKTRFVRTTYITFATALTLLGACGDSGAGDVGADKLEPIAEGTSRDSVLLVMGEGPLTAQYSDTMRLEHGFRRENYVIDGKSYEVLYYRELQGNVAEQVQQAKETPVVLQNGKVLGWGWKYYLEAMESLKLPNPTGNIPGGNGAPPAIIPTDSSNSAKADSAAPADSSKKSGA